MSIKNTQYCRALAAVVALLAFGAVAQAAPEPVYFLQDDVVLAFGQPGDPLATGTSFELDGRVVLWDINKIAGWFQFTGATTAYADVLGDQWRMDFNDPSGVLTITTEKDGGGSVLWVGTVDYFYIFGHVNDSTYDATTYDRPAYETEPAVFNYVGSAGFTRTGGDPAWSDPVLLMDWIGAYNLTLDGDTVQESENIFGNLQGKLFVPEPSGMLAFLVGGLGLASFVGKRKRRFWGSTNNSHPPPRQPRGVEPRLDYRFSVGYHSLASVEPGVRFKILSCLVLSRRVESSQVASCRVGSCLVALNE